MSGFRAVLRKDVRVLWARPATFAFLALFALSAGALTFYTGRFFDANRAELTTLFVFLPWLLVIFTPALAMEALSAERRSGTADLLYSLPIKPAHIIIAKWLSLWIICLVALILTMSLWISVSWLGQPDHAVIISGYLGAALMAAAYCALALAASARTTSPVMAFLGALMLNIALTIGALPAVKALPELYARSIAEFSVPLHQTHFLHGVLSLSDTLFFILLTGFGLFAATQLWRGGRFSVVRLILGVLAVLALNAALSTRAVRALRMDLTHDRLYTLSPATRNIIKQKDTPTRWTFYFSRALAAHYPDIRTYGAQVEETLQSFVDAAQGRISLHVIDPGIDNPREDQALALGFEALPTDRGEPLYFGLTDQQGVRINRFDPARMDSLEYDLARALSGDNTARPAIALYDGIDMAGRDWYVTGRKESLFYTELAKRYSLDLLTLGFGLEDLRDHILVMVHPPAFAPEQQQALSDFIAEGGRAIIFLDPYSEVSARPALNGLPKNGARMASVAPGFLLSMRLGWSSTKIILDRQTAMPVARTVDGATRTMRQPAWMGIPPTALSTQNPVTTHLKRGLIMASAARLGFGKDQGWMPLITTSNNTALFPATMFAADPSPQELMAGPPSSGKAYAIGVYKDGVIVLGDADMLDDEFYVHTDPVFGKRAQADNTDLVLNALDWLNGDENLLRLRTRSTAIRTLSRIDAMRAAAEQQYQNLQSTGPGISEQEQQVTLRAVRQKFHRQIKGFETALELINIWLAPLLVMLLGGGFSLWRRRRSSP